MNKKTSLKDRTEIREYFKKYYDIDNIWIEEKEDLIISLKKSLENNIRILKELYKENPNNNFFKDFTLEENEKIKKYLSNND